MDRTASPSRRSVDSYGLGPEIQYMASRTGRSNVVPDAIGDSTLDPAHPREVNSPVVALSLKVYRQILGLNPFKTSYFSLYASLDNVWDRCIAVLGVICAIAAGVPIPIISVIFSKLIDNFPPTPDEIHTRVSQLLGVAVAYFVVTSIYAMSFGWTSEKISIRLRQKLLDCLLHLDQSYLDTHDLDVNAMLTEKIDLIHTGCSEKVGIFLQSIAYFVAAFIVGFILSPKLTGILLAAVIPTMVLIVWVTSTNIAKFSKRAGQYDEKANAVVESALRAVRVVQAFNMMSAVCAEHQGLVRDSVKASVRKAIVSAFQVGAIFFTAHAINGLAFYVGSNLLASGQSGGTAGTVFAVVLLILDSSFVVAQFAPFMDIFARAASARETMGELFDARTESDRKRNLTQTNEPRQLEGAVITFQDTTFSYPARPAVPVLTGLNLSIPPRSFTAIVGTSGGGKSTLVSLLTGLYDYSGGVRIGNDELRSLNIAHLRSQVAVVEQDPILFSGTIYDNICNGLIREELTQEELDSRCRKAAKQAGVDFLDDLPQGIHTRIGNEMQLSGGQKQRICLARALIGRPAVLIADEPTSALDARSEVLVMDSIKAAAASGTTVIMIAHRLSTVLDADRIAVVSDGKVVEEGTPQELSEAGNVFKGLLNAQNTDLDRRSSDNESPERMSLSKSERSLGKGEDEEATDELEATVEVEKISFRTSAAHFWRIIRPESPLIAFGLFASMVAGAILLGEAIIFGNLVSLLNQNVNSPNFQGNANFFCLMFFILGCVALASWASSGTAFGISSARCVTHVRTLLLDRFLYLDMEWFAQKGHSVHELLGAFTKDAGDLSCLSGAALGTIFTTVTSVVGGIILAHVVAWKIAVVLLSAVPVMLVAGFLRLRVLGAADARRRSAYTAATGLAAEACRSRRTVAVFGLEDSILEQYQQSLEGPYQKSRWFTAWSNVLLAVSFAVTYFVYSLAYWWGARQVRDGMYSEREFFIVLPALLFSAQSSGQLFSLSPEIARAKAAFRNIFKLLSARPTILQPGDIAVAKSSVEDSSSEQKPVRKRNIPRVAFERVSLSYPGREGRAALREASLTVERGQTIAFVGPSGAGKSTTVSLIERFYDPTGGSVHFDGTDIRELDIRQLRDRIGLVSQEPDLLPGSIAYNIRLGAVRDQNVTDADVEAVCKQCGLHDFIQSLPEGYNTECGSSGSSKLSGGQKQRVALARALIRKPELLLLDEPTSALDAHSERQVQEALQEAVQGRTTIIVAHRLASIQEADKIYVFDEGKVVEQGSHSELVALGGLYASMAKAQSLV